MEDRSAKDSVGNASEDLLDEARSVLGFQEVQGALAAELAFDLAAERFASHADGSIS